MKSRTLCALAAALAVSTAFATPMPGAAAGKPMAVKSPPMTPPSSMVKPPPTANGIRINPQPLPPLDTRAGGDPPTVIDRR